jgi:hypothetical protein
MPDLITLHLIRAKVPELPRYAIGESYLPGSAGDIPGNEFASHEVLTGMGRVLVIRGYDGIGPIACCGPLQEEGDSLRPGLQGFKMLWKERTPLLC